VRDRDYPLLQAAEDLRKAELLAGVHVYRSGRWYALNTDDSRLDGLVFRSATLDSRETGDGALFVALQGESCDGRDFIGDALRKGAGAALTRAWDSDVDPVLSGAPKHDACILLSPDPEKALTELARAHRRRCSALVFGVTGTNGKTTTKDLLSAILATHGRTTATDRNLNNDLGVPLTLLDLSDEDRFAVVEMGASAAGDIARLAQLAKPTVGVITNAAGAHLDGFGSLETIIRTKGELLAELPTDGRAILNADSPGFDHWTEISPCPVVSWGRGAGDHRWSWQPVASGGGTLILDDRQFHSPLNGEHNAANLAAAILAAGEPIGLDLDISWAMDQFVASPHRGQAVDIAGVHFIDDSYNANPVSLYASAGMLAQMATDGRRIAVVGGMAELGPDSERLHFETGVRLAELKLDLLLGVGEATAPLVDGYRGSGARARACSDHADAVTQLMSVCQAGDRVLIKGSRSAAMEKIIELYGVRSNCDLDRL
jgi:UDP-N-acetylmuramoyl-tripeptide--D-alanyl-D-alanine ligase